MLSTPPDQSTAMLQLLRIGPVIPVIVIDDAAQAAPLAEALLEGGVKVLEVTLRTPAALEAVHRMRNVSGELHVGVGTVTCAADLARARDAGATFAVSPGLTQELAAAAAQSSFPLLPGVMTPSEVMQARQLGYRQLKLFPAAQAGGIGMLKALSGPFPDVTFCPTGGIDAAAAVDYLKLSNVACVGGSWLVPANALRAGDWERVSRLARAASSLVIDPVGL